MENKVIYTDKDEEIDLASLFKKGWGLFKRRLKLFLAFILAGIVFAIAYYNFTPPIYKSRMIISSTLFQGPSFVLILENLQILLKEENYEELASTLGIDLAVVKKIDKIEVYSSKNYAEQTFGDKVTFKDEKLQVQEEDKVEKSEEFVIEAFVADNSVFKILEQGIIYYLNNNPSMKESSIIKKEALNEMKNNIRNQRVELDSLKSSIAMVFDKKNAPTNFFIGEPGAMFTDMVELYKEEIIATEALFASNINVIESFRLYKKQHSPKLILSLIIFTLLFSFLFMITAIVLEVNEKREAA